MIVDETNFFKNTFVVFKGCREPKRPPDFISYKKNTTVASSCYWYGKNKRGNYVIRKSDHWSKVNRNIDCKIVGTCVWELRYKRETTVGKAYFKDFNGRGK